MSNAFGDHEKGALGDILNSLHDLGIPLTTVTRIQLDADRKLYIGKEIVAEYKYIESLREPLFDFDVKSFIQIPHRTIIDGVDSYVDFRLELMDGHIGVRTDVSRDPMQAQFFLDFMADEKNRPWVIDAGLSLHFVERTNKYSDKIVYLEFRIRDHRLANVIKHRLVTASLNYFK